MRSRRSPSDSTKASKALLCFLFTLLAHQALHSASHRLIPIDGSELSPVESTIRAHQQHWTPRPVALHLSRKFFGARSPVIFRDQASPLRAGSGGALRSPACGLPSRDRG